MKIIGTIVACIAGLITLIALGTGLEWFGIKKAGVFAPMRENVRRETFERSQSFTHGKVQDLAKYYEEARKADTPEDVETIRQLVILNFTNFDAATVDSPQLRAWLVEQRGY